jgi:pyruvate/2-oxoglutarate dehydrogenase complex dihydrolipoamide dehydrogenase (E3) component
MVASGRVAYLARRAADYGVHTGPISVDMGKVRQRKRDIVDSFRNGSQSRIEGTEGVDLLFGEATFTGPKTLDVRMNAGGTRSLTAATIIINTGARPARPDLEGIADVPVLDSTSIMELDVVPDHLLVLGGGTIALEFGQLFHRLGSKVTIVQRGKRLLGREDPDVADAVAGILREDGLDLLLDTSLVRVARAGDGMALTVRTPDGERTLTGSHLLAALGRTPNTDVLNPAATGVQVDARGFIPVNERLETSVPGIYALGDVNGGPAFTHISYDDYRILRTNLIEGGAAVTTGRLGPAVTYIDPQLGRVGLSEEEARAQGRKFRVAKMPMNYVARALEVDESRGFLKALVDPDTEQIIGCAVLGLEGGELMSMLQIAMMGGVRFSTLREAIFAHPTLAEGFNNLFGSFADAQ